MAEEDLDGAQVAGALVDLGCLGAPELMRAIAGWVETDAGDPFLDQALVLTRGDVGAGADPPREKPVTVGVSGPPDPGVDRLTGGRRDLEPDRCLGLLLDDHRPHPSVPNLRDVTDLQAHEVTTPELRVDGQVEERQVTAAPGDLEADPIAQTSFGWRGGF